MGRKAAKRSGGRDDDHDAGATLVQRLYVWQVVDTVRESGNSVTEAAEYLGLPERHVEPVVDYYADFTDEVDQYREEQREFERRERERWERSRDFLPLIARRATSGEDHCGLLLTSDSSMPLGKGGIGLYTETLRELMDANRGTRALANHVRWLP